MKKFLAFIIIIALCGYIGWQVYEKVMSASAKPTMRGRGSVPVAVEVKPVLKTTVRDFGDFTGSLYPRWQFVVAPKVGGRLEKLLVDIGDRVKRGQLIAVLEDDEYLQQVNQAKAELEVARAKVEESLSLLDTARREYNRAKALRKKKITSESELDSTEAQFKAKNAMHKVTKAQVTQKEAALRAIRVRLSYTRIQATWEEGEEYRVVGERFVDEGAMLAPNTPIVSILDTSVLEAVIFVIERDYPKVRVGQEASVSTDAFPGRGFPGKIVRVAPLLKETSRQARVEIEVPNPEDLIKPGMFIRIRLEFAKHDNATVVPMTALVKRNGQQGVFIAELKEGKARFVPVTVGIFNSQLAEVIKPELTGNVVTLGQHLLRDGSPIILPGAKPGRPPSGKRGGRPIERDGRPPTGSRPPGNRS